VINKVDLLNYDKLQSLIADTRTLLGAAHPRIICTMAQPSTHSIIPWCDGCKLAGTVDLEDVTFKCANKVCQQYKTIVPAKHKDSGIDELIVASFDLLPEVQKRTWVSAQQYNISLKDKEAQKIFLEAYNTADWSVDAYSKPLVEVVKLAQMFKFENWGKHVSTLLKGEEEYSSVSMSFFKAMDYLKGGNSSKYYMCAKLMFWYLQFRHQFVLASQHVGYKELGASGTIPTATTTSSSSSSSSSLSSSSSYDAIGEETLLKTKLPSLYAENKRVAAIMSALSKAEPIEEAIIQTMVAFKDKPAV